MDGIASPEPDVPVRGRKAGRGAPYEPRAKFVAGRLRGQILEGVLAPGERIREEAVARECGTSRIPVREALRQLQNEGLVTLTSHVGAKVAQLDLAELDEIYQIRERLEPYAIARSVPALTEEQHRRLRGYLVAMEAVAGEEDPSQWIDIDRQFHLGTYAAAPLPRLIGMVEGLWNATQQYRRAYTRLPERMPLAHIEHSLLMEAIERRDPDDADRIELMHIRRTRLTLQSYLELFDQTKEGRGGSKLRRIESAPDVPR